MLNNNQHNCLLVVADEALSLTTLTLFDIVIDYHNGAFIRLPLYVKPLARYYRLHSSDLFVQNVDPDALIQRWLKLLRSSANGASAAVVTSPFLECSRPTPVGAIQQWPDFSACAEPDQTESLNSAGARVGASSMLLVPAMEQSISLVPTTLIASAERFLQRQPLLMKLRDELQLSFFERELRTGEDLVIDERTCMMFVSVPSNVGGSSLVTPESVAKVLARLSVRFEVIWVVFEYETPTSATSVTAARSSSTLESFVVGVGSLFVSEDVNVVFRYSACDSDCVLAVRDAITQAADSATTWNSVEEWSNREWMLPNQTMVSRRRQTNTFF
jgi:hypothetical protein